MGERILDLLRQGLSYNANKLGETWEPAKDAR